MATVVDGENPYGLELHEVTSPTGSVIRLPSQAEAEWYEKQRDLYLHQYKFTSVSDMQDLDRLLTLEVMVRRWATWLTQGFDYLDARVDEKQLKDSIRDWSQEVRQVKQALGIDRVSRTADQAEDVGAYIQNLLMRAKEFGIQRNMEYEKAVTVLWELMATVKTYDRCDDVERRELALSPESIVEWIRTKVIPEWDDMQQAFRLNQKAWVRSI